MHALFQLQEDIASVIIQSLDFSDLKALTVVSHAAFGSVFQVAHDQLHFQRRLFLIPPGDASLARRLVYGLHNRGLARLGRYASLQIATSEHVDLLLEPGVDENVHSVCVKRMKSSRTPIVEIVDKLAEIGGLQTLDLTDMGKGNSSVNFVAGVLHQRGHPSVIVPAQLKLSG